MMKREYNEAHTIINANSDGANGEGMLLAIDTPNLQNTLIVKNNRQTKNLHNNRKGNRFSVQMNSRPNILE